MLDTLINKDIALFLYLNNLGSLPWDGFWLFITNKLNAIPLYLLLLYFSYRYIGLKKTTLAVIAVLLLITFSDQTSNLFKYGFQRLRPCHDEDIVGLMRLIKSTCGGMYSYFSAHAANSMAVAVFFGLLLKNHVKYIFPLLILWALLVAYSRIYIGVHFPLDILTGMLFGALYAVVVYQIYKTVLKFRKRLITKS